jgi:ATP-dependent helicase/nuclease subunit A
LFGAAQDSLVRFAQGKADRGLVDYTDMLALAFEMLDQHPQVIAAMRERVDCLVIDEFQDTNPLQFSLLWCLYRAGVPTLVVGDLKQAIMGFQDADSRLLAELQQQHAKAVSPLACNWRSHPGLMQWINELGAGLFNDAYTRLEPKADFPSSLNPLELIEFTATSKNAWRAEHTVARVKALLDDPETMVWDKELKQSRRIRGGDIAFLCPTNPRLLAYAESLRQLGIRVRIDADGWFESRIIQLAYHALCYVADPHDSHAALYLSVTELGSEDLQSGVEAMLAGDEPESALLKKLKSLRDGCVQRLPASLLADVTSVLDLYGLIARWPDGEQARANLLRFEAEAQEFVAANRDALAASGFYGSDLKTFLAWIKDRSEREDAQPEPRVRDEEAVQLMTWHRSKGREWPVVVVCAIDSEIRCVLPEVKINYKDFSDLNSIIDNARLDFYPEFAAPEKTDLFRNQLWPESIDSARRLLYVALTRAREKVVLEWPLYIDNGKERKKFTYWEQLVEDTQMSLLGNKVTLGGHSFDCRATQVGKDRELLFEEEMVDSYEMLPELGRRALSSGAPPSVLTPEAIRPSTLEVDVDFDPADLVKSCYAGPLTIEFDRPANVRGNILHRCYEVMDGSRELDVIQRAAGFPFTTEQFDDLQSRVQAFNAWLSERFQPESVRHEAPILVMDEKGSVITGFIDLLVETTEGYWIIDHKSDQVDDRDERFAEHLPQLFCYRDALLRINPDKPVMGIGINWVSYGQMTLLEC